jgi:hypothetical protein
MAVPPSHSRKDEYLLVNILIGYSTQNHPVRKRFALDEELVRQVTSSSLPFFFSGEWCRFGELIGRNSCRSTCFLKNPAQTTDE